MKINNTLNADKVEFTIEELSHRILERFPGSSLGKTCSDFLKFTQKSKETIEWIERPNFFIRSLVFLAIAIVAGAMFGTLFTDREGGGLVLPEYS